MANRLILVRHPSKVGDEEGIYRGNADCISKKGEEEMGLVIARLKLLHPDAVTCSFLPRAVVLAERIAEELNLPVPIRSEFFNEIDKPQFLVGMPKDDPYHQKVMQAVRRGFDCNRIPTKLLRGETIKTRREIEEEIRRMFQFVENFPGDPIPPDVLVAVSSAKKIAAILYSVFFNGSLKGYYKTADRALKVSPAGISILTREENRRSGEMHWHIQTVNEEAHTVIGFEEQMREYIRQI